MQFLYELWQLVTSLSTALRLCSKDTGPGVGWTFSSEAALFEFPRRTRFGAGFVDGGFGGRTPLAKRQAAALARVIRAVGSPSPESNLFSFFIVKDL